MNNKFNIKKIDFGLNEISNSKKSRKNLSENIPQSSKTFVQKIQLFLGIVVRYFKKSLSFLKKIKWKVSRSIFLGRGVYFKYVANLSVLIMCVMGVLIYTSSSSFSNGKGFLSKYASASDVTDPVLVSSGGQTLLSTSKFDIVRYTVQPGDTLSSIAQKHSTTEEPFSVDSIKWANGLTSDTLVVGKVLEFPPVNGTIHTVKKDDKLVDIAKKYHRVKDGAKQEEIDGVLQEIRDINGLDVRLVGDTREPVIVEGQKLIIPNGVIIPEPPKVAVKPAQPVNKPVQNKPVNNVPAQPVVVISQPSNSGLIWPVEERDGNKYVSQYYSRFHTAIDIADRGSPNILAMGNGTVTEYYWQNAGGNCIRIQFDNGYSAFYAHLANPDPSLRVIDPKNPPRVTQGQRIANMGMTGSAVTGIHLHLTVNDAKGNLVDPLKVIPR